MSFFNVNNLYNFWSDFRLMLCSSWIYSQNVRHKSMKNAILLWEPDQLELHKLWTLEVIYSSLWTSIYPRESRKYKNTERNRNRNRKYKNCYENSLKSISISVLQRFSLVLHIYFFYCFLFYEQSLELC